MPPKRPNGDGDELSGREKKKVKISAARTIAVQNAIPSGTAGASSSSQAATSSSKLPRMIDVEKFVEARAFEISAMHDAMKNASASSTHRVWQTLPRHLRRRAASHDVRRVPARLRDRARAEMDVVRKVALGRSNPKRGKAKRPLATVSFLKRQRDKSWLETHIWHAKRMHMENMWGYRLAVQPTEKSYRPSHRAAIHDAILHDASYFAFTEINGPETLLKTLFDRICDPQKASPGAQRYMAGARTVDTHVYEVGAYPFGLIAPVTIVWRAAANPAPDPTQSSKTAPTPTPAKGKEKASSIWVSHPLRQRSVWVKIHPSVYESVIKTLQAAASLALSEYVKQNPEGQELKLEFIDLRDHLRVFEVMGPKSSQVLKGCLKPIASDKRTEFKEFWDCLGDLQSSACLARNMIIGFKVNDPRLNFPPKNAKPGKLVAPSKHIFPSSQLADNDLWEEEIRKILATPTFTKQDLDQRRAQNPIPGENLNNQRQDDRIPVMLIQRSLEAQSQNTSQAIHGWTLIIPAGWSMAFWTTLVYTGTRIGGQRERQSQSYEAGSLYWPRDYPFTSPYEDWAAQRETEAKGKWEKKPPAKRVNFEKLGTKHPWKADWLGVLGIEGAKEIQAGKDEAYTTTQREPCDLQNPEITEKIRPWLLRGSETATIISDLTSALNKPGTLLSEINRLRLKRNLNPLTNDVQADRLFQGALVNVKVTMCSRGTPEDLAMIYKFDDPTVRRWVKTLRPKQGGSVAEEESLEETTLAKEIPPQEAIVGYVTTGHFSLSRGHGYGLGAISLVRLLEMEQQNSRLHPNRRPANEILPPLMVGIRNVDGMHCRAAYLEVLSID